MDEHSDLLNWPACAAYRMAFIYLDNNDKDKAQECFQLILDKYPKSAWCSNIVKDLSEYPWSSYNHYAKGNPDDIITLDPLYEALANTSKERRDAYIEYLTKPRPYEELLDEKIATLK